MNEEPQPVALDIAATAAALEATAESAGAAAMLAQLTETLRQHRQWHGVFDAELLTAREALGLPMTGSLAGVGIDPGLREKLDARSISACREVGRRLLDEGQVAAAWMYLRAAGDQSEVRQQLNGLADRLLASHDPDDEGAGRQLQEILHLSLWEGVDPALGLRLMLTLQGTCNAITAYDQAIVSLPADRQQATAAVLVEHLYGDVLRSLRADLEAQPHQSAERLAAVLSGPRPLAGLLADASVAAVFVDVSHLQAVLRFARVSTDPAVIDKAWELACYACRLPNEVRFPGEPPFENVGEGSRHFFGAQLADADAATQDEAVAFFRVAAEQALATGGGPIPHDILALLSWRLGRADDALEVVIARPPEDGFPSPVQVAGMLPSLVDMAQAGGAAAARRLREACVNRGDLVTFAASLALSTDH
jgi:hypothetical protein